MKEGWWPGFSFGVLVGAMTTLMGVFIGLNF